METGNFLVHSLFPKPIHFFRDDPLVRYEFEEIKAAIDFDRTGIQPLPITRFKAF